MTRHVFKDVSGGVTHGQRYIWDGKEARYWKVNDRLGAVNYALTSAIELEPNKTLYITGGRTYKLIDTTTHKEVKPVFTPATITTADHVKSVIASHAEGKSESGGGSVDYYKVPVTNPTTAPEPYVAECNDIIESLNLTYAEANILKEIWRTAAQRELGVSKAGNSNLRAAEKVIFFAERYGVQHGKISKDNQ